QRTRSREMEVDCDTLLAGKIVCNGQGLPHVKLSLHSSEQFPVLAPETSDPLILQEASEMYPNALLRCETKSDGSFWFGGLPKHWNGELLLPDDLRQSGTFAGGRSRIAVRQPSTGMEINVERLLSLRGRIVDDVDGVAATI